MEIVDISEFMYDNDTEEVAYVKKKVHDALIETVNTKNEVDVEYIAKLSGLTIGEAVQALRGAIFQRPECFDENDEYDESVGWVLSSRYLSGNIRDKLKAAKKANKRFPGRFASNIEALKRILPPKIEIDDIHLNLGASWIPVEEISMFIMKLLNLKTLPEVILIEDLKIYKIVKNPETENSVANLITYGVRDDKFEGVYGITRQYLTALDIIEQTLNAKTVKVYDYIPDYTGLKYKYEPVLNRNKTVEAQNKQKLIIEAFRDYVYGNAKTRARFEEYYNNRMVGYAYSVYNGDFLEFEGMNPEITLYKHQRDVIARVLLSGNNVLISHDVGTGKSYEMIVSAHELYRLGMSKKNLIVVPNNVLADMERNHRTLYKDDKILVIYPSDFIPSKRKAVLDKIINEDFVAIYMAYSSFDMLVMSKQYYLDKFASELRRIRTAIFNADSKYEKSALKRREKALEDKIAKYILEEQECRWQTFDELGIETLVVDEAHNYKNIPIRANADDIVGMGKGSSRKCKEMLEKAHSVKRIIFATGTPLTNSIADLFAFQTYLEPELLAYHNIDTFDAWINTFGSRETSIECDVDANSTKLRTMTRFSSFHNLGELMGLFMQVCDFHHMPTDCSELPGFNGYTDVCVPKNDAQRDYFLSLSERTEKIRNKEVKRSEDNLLKVTTDGRMAAVDIRLISDEQFSAVNGISKTDVCAKKVVELNKKYPDTTQIVFCDIGTPKERFNVYDELASSLIKEGMDAGKIAYVHDATSENARKKLFEAMNKGELSVVIGSTQKLGVGVNVQEKLIAIHHLSVPWRPADMVQREGRILRKGNTCDEVFIYRYITEGSFDMYSWQILENKQRFISSFLKGISPDREIDDIADTVLTYAEVKALAIGNPLIKKRVELANLLERVKISCRSRQKELLQLENAINTLPSKIDRLNKLAAIARKDFEGYIGSKEKIPNEEREAFGEELIYALSDNINRTDERFFDTYRGVSVYLPKDMMPERRYVVIKTSNGGEYRCDMEGDKTPLGCSRSIEALLERLDKREEELMAGVSVAKKQLAEAKADSKRGNPYLAEVEEIKKQLQEVDLELELPSEAV